MNITIHDPREKGNRPPRKKKDNAEEIDELADKGLGLFIKSSSLELDYKIRLVRELLCSFPYPWLCLSADIGRDYMREEFISRVPNCLEVIRSTQSDYVISIICKHSIENVSALFDLYNHDPAWFVWSFSVAYESSYPELVVLAQTTGILDLWERLEEVDDGMKELMPYYIICDEDWQTIHVRCMDTELYDPFVEYAQQLIDEQSSSK